MQWATRSSWASSPSTSTARCGKACTVESSYVCGLHDTSSYVCGLHDLSEAATAPTSLVRHECGWLCMAFLLSRQSHRCHCIVTHACTCLLTDGRVSTVCLV